MLLFKFLQNAKHMSSHENHRLWGSLHHRLQVRSHHRNQNIKQGSAPPTHLLVVRSLRLFLFSHLFFILAYFLATALFRRSVLYPWHQYYRLDVVFCEQQKLYCFTSAYIFISTMFPFLYALLLSTPSNINPAFSNTRQEAVLYASGSAKILIMSVFPKTKSHTDASDYYL